MNNPEKVLADRLKNHDMIFEVKPLKWLNGIPMGNGNIGAMLWGDGAPLKITLDKYDIWETREVPHDLKEYKYNNIRKLVSEKKYDEIEDIVFTLPADDKGEIPNPTKLPLPRLEIEELKWNGGRLVLANALFKSSRWDCFVHATKNLLVIKGNSGDNIEKIVIKIDYPAENINADETSFGRNMLKDILKRWGYPELERGCSDGIQWVRQGFPTGGSYVIAWRFVEDMFVLTICSSRESDNPLQTTCDNLKSENSYDLLLAEHTGWWADFWNRSSITIPDKRLENLYYIEMYKLGSITRPDGYPINLQGIWTKDGCMPPWSGDYHLDMNIQESYWPVYTSNHLELGSSLYEKFYEWMPRFKKNCRDFFGCGGAWARCSVGIDGIEIANKKRIGYSALMCCQSYLPWVAHHFWLHYKYSRDKKFLKTRAVPFMKECWLLYENVLEVGDDNKLHLPVCQSPEYNECTPRAWQRDSSHDRALIQFLCEALIEADDILGNKDTDRKLYKDMLENLYDYPGDDEFWVADGQPYDHSHRHPCHLMAIHPLGLMTVEGDETEKTMIKNSFKTLIEMGSAHWAGHTFPQISLLASRTGMAEMAWNMAQQHFFYIEPNSLHRNGDPRRFGFSVYTDTPMTLEAGFASAAAILEMLIQSWGGIIRVFPATPDFWDNCSFSKLLAEGAIEVSSEKKTGKVRWIEVTSKYGGIVKVKNVFGTAVIVNGIEMNDDILSIDTEPQKTVRIVPRKKFTEDNDSIVSNSKQQGNWFGLKKVPRF